MSTNKTSRFLPAYMVLDADPCPTYRNRFEERYEVTGVEVTVELAVSQSEDWDWYWAADALLSYEGYDEFRSRVSAENEAYDKYMAPFRTAISAAYDNADRVYEEFREAGPKDGQRWDEFYAEGDRLYGYEMAVARAAEEAMRGVLNKRLRVAEATAFAEIFISEGEPKVEQEVEQAPEDDGLCHCWVCEARRAD